MNDDDFRTDPKPPDQPVDINLIPGLLLRMFHDAGDDDLVRAALDQRLSWVAEEFDEFGHRHVTVWFGDEEIAVARFHWSLLSA